MTNFVALEVEDLEAVETPEAMIMKGLLGEGGAGAAGAAAAADTVTPWLRFMWEAYRTVLDLLRNAPKLETLYQETARGALIFCHTYGRKTEFRRLCDMLRNHLSGLLKGGSSAASGGGYSLLSAGGEASFAQHLETRFQQLKVATGLELWQEAFRSLEDLHGLFAGPRRAWLKPAFLAQYYEQAALVFRVAGNELFHAAALFSHYTLVTEKLGSLYEGNGRMAMGYSLISVCRPKEPVGLPPCAGNACRSPGLYRWFPGPWPGC